MVLGFVGRFSTYGFRKGADLLQQVNDLDFVELAVTDGDVAQDALPAFYRSLDYILVTSRYEGGPMCLLEGLACGKKIICPLDIGFADMFTEGVIPYAKVILRLYAKFLWTSIRKNYEYRPWCKNIPGTGGRLNIYACLPA